jgi:hypothetical protein
MKGTPRPLTTPIAILRRDRIWFEAKLTARLEET